MEIELQHVLFAAEGDRHELGEVDDGNPLEIGIHAAGDFLAVVEVEGAERAADRDHVCALLAGVGQDLVGAVGDDLRLVDRLVGPAAFRLVRKVDRPSAERP